MHIANQDPVAKMLGDRFAYVEAGEQDSADYRYVEEIMKSGGGQEEDREANDKMLVLRMLFYLGEFDKRLLSEAVKIVSSYVLYYCRIQLFKKPPLPQLLKNCL